MDKSQALNEFWSSFGLPAYEVNTIPDGEKKPYITYESGTDSIGNVLPLTASIWYESTSWEAIKKKAAQIEKYLYDVKPISKKIDGGRIYISGGSPFAKPMSDEDDRIKRIVINIMVEFFTAY